MEYMQSINYQKNIKKRFISLENIIRALDIGLDRKVFFNIELLLRKEIALKNQIYLELYLETNLAKKTLLKREITFSEDKVVFENSHEDPTVEIDDSYCFAMTIERNELKKKMKEFNLNEEDILSIGGEAYIYDKNQKIIVLKDCLSKDDIPWDEIWSDYLFTEIVGDYKIKVNKEAVLTFHMNNKYGIYKEETRNVQKNEIVDFKDYLKTNTYLGIQFSINDPYSDKDLDIEEKYVVKGQKGMVKSNLLLVGDDIYYPNILFNEKYLLKIISEDKEINKDISAQVNEDSEEILWSDFKEINTIEDLVMYYSADKNTVKFFEMNYNYLLELYKNKNTYAQSGIYSTNKKSKFFHVDQEICKNCEKISRCIQNVPSNLSDKLYKKIILLEDKSGCDLYKVL